jgi:AbrB family looped-hinge helix DNA binding protein
MTIATISEKGQLTLPAKIRRQAKIHPGSKVEVELRAGEIVLHPIKSLLELGGILHKYAVNAPADYDLIREQAIAREAEEIDRDDHE